MNRNIVPNVRKNFLTPAFTYIKMILNDLGGCPKAFLSIDGISF